MERLEIRDKRTLGLFCPACWKFSRCAWLTLSWDENFYESTAVCLTCGSVIEHRFPKECRGRYRTEAVNEDDS